MARAKSKRPDAKTPSLFDAYPRDELEEMLEAGAEILEWYRVLRKAEANVVGELLKGQGTFYEWDHYPPGDIYDHETHSQYYYHAHRGEQGEHGHFHSFQRRDGMPAGVAPVPYEGEEEWPTGDEMISHLAGVSMDKMGYPTHLFTTNRWVTGENFYPADDVVRMLAHFDIDHVYPSWPTNRWLTAMLVLFHPQIVQLLHQRDAKVAAWQAEHPDTDAFEDRDLEVTSICTISVNHQIKQLRKAIKNLGG